MDESRWDELEPSKEGLAEARLVLHYAVQLVAAVGQSLGEKAPDDSQQSLSLEGSGVAWLGTPIAGGTLRAALDPAQLDLRLCDGAGAAPAAFPLAGRTLAEGLAFLGAELVRHGQPASTFALPRHPADLPHHPLADGARFPAGTDGGARGELVRLFANTHALLAGLREGQPAPLRLWPHHFDLACSLQLAGHGLLAGRRRFGPALLVRNPVAPAGDRSSPAAGRRRHLASRRMDGSRAAAGAPRSRRARNGARSSPSSSRPGPRRARQLVMDPLFILSGAAVRHKGGEGLGPVDLTIAAGSTTVLLGTSGAGKSTLLRLLNGLLSPGRGKVLFRGHPPSPAHRIEMGYVVQGGGLFPHLTAAGNVALVARWLVWESQRIEERLHALADLVRVPAEALMRFPAQLSGGQAQRVGLMHALMLDAPVLLLDEPLGSLDPITRFDLQRDLRDVFRQLGKTVVLVTHDLGEAAFFGGTVVLLREVLVVQKGALDELIRAPADPFVTRFVQAQRSPLGAA